MREIRETYGPINVPEGAFTVRDYVKMCRELGDSVDENNDTDIKRARNLLNGLVAKGTYHKVKALSGDRIKLHYWKGDDNEALSDSVSG